MDGDNVIVVESTMLYRKFPAKHFHRQPMGGVFVRQLVGGTGLGPQLHKLLPLVLLTHTPENGPPFSRHFGWILLSGLCRPIWSSPDSWHRTWPT